MLAYRWRQNVMRWKPYLRHKRPVALNGGAKVSTKLAVLENLVSKVDFLIIGGGMANTFLLRLAKILGIPCEQVLLQRQQQILADAA